MRKLKFAVLLTLSMLITSIAVANSDPVAMLKMVTSNVMQALKANQRILKAEPEKIYGVVDRYVVPYVDFNEMGKWIAGKKIWAESGQASRNRFIKEFKSLVVRTYGMALNNYSDEKIKFAKVKNANSNRIQVSSKVIRKSNDNIRVDYRLVAKKSGWKVYDIIIEGVSILQGFQAQFSNDIRNHGLDSVIDKMHEHNIKRSKPL